MGVAGLLYVLAGIALFLVVPVLALAGTWRRLDPSVRRALIILYLVILGAAVLLYWGIDRWASSGPLA